MSGAGLDIWDADDVIAGDVIRGGVNATASDSLETEGMKDEGG